MNWIQDLLMPNGQLFGIEWHFWKVIGWIGNLMFFSRFVVQWYISEKRKEVVIPIAFWWLSLGGSLLLLLYAVFSRRDSVFIAAYAFTWIPYIRNLILHYRNKSLMNICSRCGQLCSAKANYCQTCGIALKETTESVNRR